MDKRLDDPTWLVNAYSTRSSQDIANELNCSNGTVLRALRRFGVAIKPGGSYRKGKPMSWEQRVKISETAKQKRAKTA